jgi:hypothetical protein
MTSFGAPFTSQKVRSPSASTSPKAGLWQSWLLRSISVASCCLCFCFLQRGVADAAAKFINIYLVNASDPNQSAQLTQDISNAFSKVDGFQTRIINGAAPSTGAPVIVVAGKNLVYQTSTPLSTPVLNPPGATPSPSPSPNVVTINGGIASVNPYGAPPQAPPPPLTPAYFDVTAQLLGSGTQLTLQIYVRSLIAGEGRTVGIAEFAGDFATIEQQLATYNVRGLLRSSRYYPPHSVLIVPISSADKSNPVAPIVTSRLAQRLAWIGIAGYTDTVNDLTDDMSALQSECVTRNADAIFAWSVDYNPPFDQAFGLARTEAGMSSLLVTCGGDTQWSGAGFKTLTYWKRPLTAVQLAFSVLQLFYPKIDPYGRVSGSINILASSSAPLTFDYVDPHSTYGALYRSIDQDLTDYCGFLYEQQGRNWNGTYDVVLSEEARKVLNVSASPAPPTPSERFHTQGSWGQSPLCFLRFHDDHPVQEPPVDVTPVITKPRTIEYAPGRFVPSILSWLRRQNRQYGKLLLDGATPMAMTPTPAKKLDYFGELDDALSNATVMHDNSPYSYGLVADPAHHLLAIQVSGAAATRTTLLFAPNLPSQGMLASSDLSKLRTSQGYSVGGSAKGLIGESRADFYPYGPIRYHVISVDDQAKANCYREMTYFVEKNKIEAISLFENPC